LKIIGKNLTPSVPQNFGKLDGLFNKILAISSTIPTFVQNYSFSKSIAKMLAPKSQYSLLIAKMFAPKSQYSHRELASFGDYRRAIFQSVSQIRHGLNILILMNLLSMKSS